MKITLENFRYHRDLTLEIPDKGLVLLSGKSGAGKSTILKAISYALYGKVRKPYSYGTQTCKVILEIKGMIITRSNRPNRLIVSHEGTKYEDSSAQGVIHQIFGVTFQEFMASSYVVQRLNNSVVSMSPGEQVKFVQTLAFEDGTHNECKMKIKEKIIETKSFISNIKGQLLVLESQISTRENDLPIDVSPPEVDGMSIKNIKTEQTRIFSYIKLCKDKLKSMGKDLKILEKIEKQNFELTEQKRKLEIEINQFSQRRNQLGVISSSEEMEELEKQLDDTKTLLDHTKFYELYQSTIKKASKFRDEHINNIKCEISKLKDKILPDSQFKKLEKTVKNAESQRKLFEEESSKIQEVKIKRDNANSTIKRIFIESKKFYPKEFESVKSGSTLFEFLIQKEKFHSEELLSTEKRVEELIKCLSEQNLCSGIYECPSCHKHLQFRDDELFITEDDNFTGADEDYDIQLMCERVIVLNCRTKLEKIREFKKDIDNSLKILSETKGQTKINTQYNHKKAAASEIKYLEHQRIKESIDSLQKQINNKNLPSSIQSLFEEAKEYKSKFPKEFQPSLEIIDITDKLSQLSSDLEEKWRTKSEHSSLSKEINIRERKMQHVVKSLKEKRFLPKKQKNSKTLRKEISAVHSELLKYTQQSTDLQKIFSAIRDYESYQKDVKELENLRLTFDKTSTILKNLERTLSGAMGLGEAAKEAEIRAMEATIESINEHAKCYLTDLFEDPISVRLEGHKLTAKGAHRTQMNTVVEYRGERSSMEDLSGGERQRCELAFLMGVNDMLGSPMILLDECLNELDGEVNMEALNYLKDLCGDRVILVVAHEAVKGIFDEIIEISN